MKALIISADGFEDSELVEPRRRLLKAGIDIDIASLHKGPITGKHGHSVDANLQVSEVHAEAYEALILPGGKAPERLRQSRNVLELSREFMRVNKPIAAICHGPQILLSAGLLKGRKATCYRSVANEMRQAGVDYVDQAVVVDGNLITSRRPSDLPLFIAAILKAIG